MMYMVGMILVCVCVCMHMYMPVCVCVHQSIVLYNLNINIFIFMCQLYLKLGEGVKVKRFPRSFQTQVAKPEAELALKLVAMGNIPKSSPQVLGLCVVCYPWLPSLRHLS